MPNRAWVGVLSAILLLAALSGCGDSSGRSVIRQESEQEHLEYRLEQRMPRLVREYQAAHSGFVPRSVHSTCQSLGSHVFRCRTYVTASERGKIERIVVLGTGHCVAGACEYQPTSFHER